MLTLNPKRNHPAFTLAELLIALVILGVIATFTIPKVLQSQQSSQWKSSGKEMASMLSGAYQAYKIRNTPGTATGLIDLTPYMNYVRIETATLIDSVQTGGSIDCSVVVCLRMHNGGVMTYGGAGFGSTATTSAVYLYFDPDGQYSGSPTGAGKSVIFWLYYNGALRTYGTVFPNTYDATSGPYNPAPALDPPWFDWS